MAPWVKIGERTVPAATIAEKAARAATGFETLGIGRDDVVAVFMRNDFPFIEATVAAGQLGAYVTPVNWHNSPAEARYVFENSGTKAIVIHTDLYEAVKDGIPEGVAVFVKRPDDEIRAAYGQGPAPAEIPAGTQEWDAWLAQFEPRAPTAIEPPGSMIYTSGTTGNPKGVRRQAPTAEQAAATRAIIGKLFGASEYLDNPEQIVAMAAGPLYHSTPNGWMGYFFNNGANLILEPRFDAERLLQLVEKHKVTHLLAVPTMFVRLLKLPEDVRKKYDLSSLKFVMHGAAPCSPIVKKEMMDWWGPVIFEHYGGTETGALTFVTPQEWLAKPGTVGKAMTDGVVVRVLDEAGNDCPVGVPGEVAGWYRDYADFTYHGDDAKRQKADRNGLVALGDVGYLDADGFLFLSGRSSDMIISGGVNIYPAEIEGVLVKMPGVADCAVFGIPDEEFGEQVCAYVQPQPGVKVTAADVKAYLKEQVAGYKVPKTVEFSDALPREDSGKIFKRKLREPYWANAGRKI
jgi:long-chain acyl-CoA synthetase